MTDSSIPLYQCTLMVPAGVSKVGPVNGHEYGCAYSTRQKNQKNSEPGRSNIWEHVVSCRDQFETEIMRTMIRPTSDGGKDRRPDLIPKWHQEMQNEHHVWL